MSAKTTLTRKELEYFRSKAAQEYPNFGSQQIKKLMAYLDEQIARAEKAEAERHSEDLALAAKNYTPDSPSVSGYYWWKCEQEQPSAVLVDVAVGDNGNVWMFIYGESPEFHTCDKCRWAGPMLKPMEE